MEDQLREYVDKIKSEPKPLNQIKQIMDDSRHADFIKAICDQLIMNKEVKTNAVWIHGRANSGKT